MPPSKARSRSGAVAIEFAVIALLLLVPMLAGVAEVGIAAYQSMQVHAAAEAGALYVAKHGTGNAAAIGLAVANATHIGTITASVATFCGCPSATGIIGQGGDCTTPCPDNTLPGHYARITTALPRVSILPILGLPLPQTLTASAVVRTQ